MKDIYFKWFLFAVFLYFALHIGFAMAQQVPSPTVPTIQCWNNGFGTIQCAPI